MYSGLCTYFCPPCVSLSRSRARTSVHSCVFLLPRVSSLVVRRPHRVVSDGRPVIPPGGRTAVHSASLPFGHLAPLFLVVELLQGAPWYLKLLSRSLPGGTSSGGKRPCWRTLYLESLDSYCQFSLRRLFLGRVFSATTLESLRIIAYECYLLKSSAKRALHPHRRRTRSTRINQSINILERLPVPTPCFFFFFLNICSAEM